MAKPKRSRPRRSREEPLDFFRQQLAGEKPLSRRSAERLFELATELIVVRPWNFLADQNLVLLEDPVSGEISYCSVMGALGEVFSLHVYVGAESYRFFRKMAAEKPISIGEFYASLRGVYVEYVPPSELTPPDRELARAFGHPLKRGLRVPIFRALRPGYHPWYVTEAEASTLAECMEAVLALSLTILAGRGADYWEEKDVYPFMLPVQHRDGTVYEVKMVKAEEPPRPPATIPPLNDVRIQQFRESNFALQGAFEADHFYGGGMIGRKNERKACIRLGMVVDAPTGFAFPPELGTPEQATAEILVRAVLKAIESARFLPQEIRVNQPQFKAFLGPLAQQLGLSVRLVERLPALGQAKDHLLAMMGDPGPIGGRATHQA